MSGQPSPDLAAARTKLRVFGGGVVDLGDRYAVQIARPICSSNKEQVPVVVGYFRPAARAWEGADGKGRHCPDWAAAVGLALEAARALRPQVPPARANAKPDRKPGPGRAAVPVRWRPRRGRAAAGEELDDRIWGELPEGD